jgi:hypothetical protein
MSNDIAVDEEDSIGQAYGESLSQALAELADLVEPLGLDYKNKMALYYLLLLWASLRVYQLEPYIESDEEGGEAKIIPLENGWKILDYGYYLTTSPGENYGTYCTGKLIQAAQTMIDIMAKRGAKRIGLLGNSVATRAAWMQSEDLGVEVNNYYPTDADYELLNKIRAFRAEAKKRLAQEDLKRPT